MTPVRVSSIFCAKGSALRLLEKRAVMAKGASAGLHRSAAMAMARLMMGSIRAEREFGQGPGRPELMR